MKTDSKIKGEQKSTAHAGVTEYRRSLRAAEMAFVSGDPGRALSIAEGIASEDPRHLPALETMARALWKLGDLPRLVAHLDRMIAFNPYEPGYHSLKGAALQSMGCLGDAIRAFSSAVDLSKGCDTSSVEMLHELRRFQSGLIELLLADDLGFRIAYRRDPVSAARERGFEIEAPVTVSRLPLEPRQPAFLSARPS